VAAAAATAAVAAVAAAATAGRSSSRGHRTGRGLRTQCGGLFPCVVTTAWRPRQDWLSSADLACGLQRSEDDLAQGRLCRAAAPRAVRGEPSTKTAKVRRRRRIHGAARPTDQKEESNHCCGFRAAGPPTAENGSELKLRMVSGLRRARKNRRHPHLSARTRLRLSRFRVSHREAAVCSCLSRREPPLALSRDSLVPVRRRLSTLRCGHRVWRHASRGQQEPHASWKQRITRKRERALRQAAAGRSEASGRLARKREGRRRDVRPAAQ
jgi:hypothetical protein